jgi:hypothetical protein
LNWKERKAASRDAAVRIKAALAADAYASLYAAYEGRLTSGDPLEVWIAREVLLSFSTRDLPRLIRAKNAQMAHCTWLADGKIRAMWPFPIALTLNEWAIIGYYRHNRIFTSADGRKAWLFDRRCFSREFHQVGDSYPDPVYEDLVIGFEIRIGDFLDFCKERRRHHGK